MLKLKHLSAKAAAMLSFGLCCAGLTAQDVNAEIARSVELAQILNDGQFRLPEYADMLVREMLQQYPGNVHLQGQRIYNLLAQQKDAEALKEAEAMKGNESAYMAALSSIGTFYVQYSKFDKGIPLLEQVVEYAFKTNKVKEYQQQMGWLLTAYENDHKADKAAALKAKIQSAMMDDDASKRDRLLSSGMLTMSTIDSLRDGLKGGLEEFENILKMKLQSMTASDAESKKKLNNLLTEIKKADATFYAALRKGEDRKSKNADRLKKYIALGGKEFLDLSEADCIRFANFREASDPGLRNTKIAILLKPEEAWNATERKIMDPKQNNPVDWLDQIGFAMKNLDQVLWGGIDIRTAIAVGQLMRAYYYIGENDIRTMEKGLTLFRKYKDLFDQCDEAYEELNEKNKKDNQPLQVSPTAAARMWEGHICKRIAEIYESQNKKADALKMYKRAFVAFGQPLRKHWRNDATEAVNCYPLFRTVKDKIIELDPNNTKFIAALNTQFARVTPPVAKQTKTYDELVDLVPLNHFRDGNKMLAEIKLKLKSKQPVSEEERKAVTAAFELAENELLGKMDGKSLSNGLPKLLYHLMLCYANGAQAQPFGSSVTIDNDLMLETLAEISSWMYSDDEYIANGLVISANSYWDKAIEMLGDVAKKKVNDLTQEDLALIETTDSIKDKAINLYDAYLKMTGGNHKNAPVVCIRIAREEFIRADRMARAINEEKDPAKRKTLEAARIAGFDRSIARYSVVIEKYNNMDNFVYEAYETSAESYTITNRHQLAVDTLKALCERSKEKAPIRMLNATINIVSHLYSVAVELNNASRDKRIEMENIVPIEPVSVEERLKAAQAAAEKAVAAAKKDDAAAKKGDAAAEKKGDAAAEKEVAADKKDGAKEEAAAPAVAAVDEKALKEKIEAEFAADQAKFQADTQRKQDLAREMKELHDLSIAKYLEAIEFANKFLAMTDKNNENQPIDPRKGIYSAMRKDANFKKQIENNELLVNTVLPWLYDGAGNRAEAVKHFEKFIEANKTADADTVKKDSKKKVQTPAYMLRLAELYAEISNTPQAEIKTGEKELCGIADEKISSIIDEMTKLFPESPEVEKSKFLSVETYFKLQKYKECLAELKKLSAVVTEDKKDGAESAKKTDGKGKKNELSIRQREWIIQNMVNLSTTDIALKLEAADFAYATCKELLAECEEILKDYDTKAQNARKAQAAAKADPKKDAEDFKEKIASWVGNGNAIDFINRVEVGKQYFNYQRETMMLRVAETANMLGKLYESTEMQAAEKAEIQKKKVDMYNEAIATFKNLETNYPKTPYRFRLAFGRALAYTSLGGAENSKAARENLISVSNTALALQAAAVRDNMQAKAAREEEVKKDPTRKFPALILKDEDMYIPYYYKAAMLLAESWKNEEVGDDATDKARYRKVALNRYKMMLKEKKITVEFVKHQTQNTPEPDGRNYKFLENYLEEAHYQAARLASELKDETALKEIQDRYKLLYPEGMFKKQINSL